jgi:hypothetical protein
MKGVLFGDIFALGMLKLAFSTDSGVPIVGRHVLIYSFKYLQKGNIIKRSGLPVKT